jgi:tripartite-type tricarboxylate transporter receptor subunit TctC
MKRVLFAVVMLLALFLPRPSRAAAYPERPIELIIPFGVGGGSDTAARASCFSPR